MTKCRRPVSITLRFNEPEDRDEWVRNATLRVLPTITS